MLNGAHTVAEEDIKKDEMVLLGSRDIGEESKARVKALVCAIMYYYT